MHIVFVMSTRSCMYVYDRALQYLVLRYSWVEAMSLLQMSKEDISY